jgi:hypothetical protein
MEIKLTLDDFAKAGLEAEELYTGIFVVRNFLKEDEISALEKQFSEMTEDDWSKSYVKSLYEFIKNQYGVDTIEEAQALGHDIKIDENWVDKNALIEDQNIAGSINQRLSKLFEGFPDLDLQGVGSIQRQYEGISLSYHVDSLSNPAVVFANVLYINDDFTGGELHFPTIDVTYRPEKGALIIFPSADDYLHGVLPVGPGPIRYALPAFVNKRIPKDAT